MARQSTEQALAKLIKKRIAAIDEAIAKKQMERAAELAALAQLEKGLAPLASE